MTHAMKAIYKLLLSDYVKVSIVSVEDMLYDEQDILRSMDKIEVRLFLFINVCFNLHFVNCNISPQVQTGFETNLNASLSLVGGEEL